MPGIVKVKVVSARDLPIMDRSSELTDAFVELRLGESYHRTRVCPKTLNPVWNSTWFSFKVSDEDLQDEPLQIKLLDHDIYTAHDAIGKVYIRLNLLTGRDTMDGWFPIYDTLHGIRGQVHLMVRVEMIREVKQSSCGVLFFACPEVPSGHSLVAIHGFVEELVVNDDPEYQWIDKIRTPRASNEARQRLFSKLSGELQRRIGVKTVEVGANAVIGYRQCFDLEGESGIVVRGIGTCVSLGPTGHNAFIQLPLSIIQSDRDELMMSPRHHGDLSLSDSDGPPSPTKVGELPASTSTGSTGLHPNTSSEIRQSSEFPFYTVLSLPPDTLTNIGGLVSAHSVKLLDKINNPDEPVTRDAWWNELRNEVRQHARVLGCNAVLGYTESTSIHDSLCVLSACGTAVGVATSNKRTSPEADSRGPDDCSETCSLCHVPYSPVSLPFEGKLSTCRLCGSGPVPAILLATSELPSGLAIRGTGTLVQATVIHDKKRFKGDDNAQQIGQILPFLEYSLHEQLLNKVRLRGLNALFRYKLLLNIGDTLILGTAVGTAVYLEALPGPDKLVVSSLDKHDQARLSQVQSQYRSQYGVNEPVTMCEEWRDGVEGVNCEAREAVVVPMTESMVKPENVGHLISDKPLPTGFQLSNTATVPGLKATTTDSKMVTVISKVIDYHRQDMPKFFHSLLQRLTFRVRHMLPCTLTNISYDIDLPEDNELQVAVTAVTSRLKLSGPLSKTQSEEMIFAMDHTSDHTHQPTEPSVINMVHISSLPSIPGHQTKHYLGIINLFLIRESTSVSEMSRANGFMHLFTLEASSIARAHVRALGGNALLSFRLSEVVFIEHPQKSQAQCLLNLSGDAAVIESCSQPLRTMDTTTYKVTSI